MAFLLNCLVSMVTGTAFGTTAVVGVVCAAIGQAAQIPFALVGGAVISGAYFGDRCSPASTSALLVAELTGTTTAGNMAGMLRTAAVPFVACCIAYLGVDAAITGSFSMPDLFGIFGRELAISPVTLLPIAAVLALCILRVRLALALFSGVALAAALCATLQHDSVAQIARMAVMGFSPNDSEVASMLGGGGVVSMLSVAAIVCVSSSYAGIFQKTGLLDGLKSEATVKEILPALYNGDTFSGYDRVHLPYAKLDRIFKREIMPSYHDALASVTGVYCLTDTKTGMLYIGSATGEGGVAARWGNYLDSQHEDNKGLRDLYEHEGEEYFRKHFEFTLLEYFGMSYDPQKVLEREQWWKDCLDTRKHGYNEN